ncbi:MAG: phage terminase large subunit family protein, partial [Geminicoccaceae bacterium]
SPEASAEPGQWITARAEFQREMMDAITDPEVEQVVLMTGSQVGKTEVIINTFGFFVDMDPSPILMIEPRVEDAKSLSKDRMAPMLRDTPALRDKVAEARSRDSGNTVLHKTFPGGHVTMVGANSPAGLAMRPIRVLLADEIDRYPVSAGGEGDPLTLGIRRTSNFYNRRIVICSTPTDESHSRIADAYEESDQRRFYVPCPDCDHEQVLSWDRVEWDRDENGGHLPATAAYCCKECGSLWGDGERWAAVARGRWIAEAEHATTAGFWLSALYSPWQKLSAMAAEYIASRGDTEREKVFANTILGLTYRERGDAPDAERLYERREQYERGVVPERALIVTAGVDVQDDRLEVSIIGWGRDLESWLVDHLVIPGDPTGQQVWDDLDRKVRHWAFPGVEGRIYRVARMAVDSGDNTSSVYAYWRRAADQRVLAIKGFDRLAVTIGMPNWVEVDVGGKKFKRGVQLWPVGSSFAKTELYSWLRRSKPDADEPAERYCHFPDMPEEYFKQLTAEELVTKKRRSGYTATEWQKVRLRNEALDCWIYARAAAAQLGIDRYGDHQWAELEMSVGITPQPREVEPSTQPAQRPRPSSSPGRQSGWLDRRRTGKWL